MSALIPSTSRAAALGYRSIRKYAATALAPAPEIEQTASTEAGPSQPRSPRLSSSPSPSKKPTTASPPRMKVTESSQSSLELDNTARDNTERNRRAAPRTFARQAAVQKAQAFAKALKANTPPPVIHTTIEPTLEMIPENPTMADLLAKRPSPPHLPPHHPNYEGPYRAVFARIDNAFMRGQLLGMTKELGWKQSSRLPKYQLIQRLLAEWGWEYPVRDKVVGPQPHHDFEMETSELFLVMREDAGLLPLMQSRIPTTFSIITPEVTPQSSAPKSEPGRHPRPESAPPTPARSILRGTGPEVNLSRVAELVRRKRSTIKTETLGIDALFGYRPSAMLIRALSGLYGCYVEMLDTDTIRLSSSRLARIKKTIRVLVQTASRRCPIHHNHMTAMISPAAITEAGQAITERERLTLGPFHTSTRNQLPWDISGMLDGSFTARLRRTVVWEAKPSRAEQAHREEIIESADVWANEVSAVEDKTLGRLISTKMATLKRNASPLAESSVVATFGHLLRPVKDPLSDTIYPGERKSTPQNPIPAPPDSRAIVFVPSSTPSMIQFPLTSTSKRIRRLKYRCIDQSLVRLSPNTQLVFTWNYPVKSDRTVTEELDEEKAWQDEMDAMMAKAEKDVLDQDSTESSETSTQIPEESEEDVDIESEVNAGLNEEDTSIEEPSKVVFNSEIHNLATANLRFPDRPVDAFVAARSVAPLLSRTLPITDVRPNERLAGVKEFFQRLENRTNGTGVTLAYPPAHVVAQIGDKDLRFALISDEECRITELDRGDGVILRTVKSSEPDIAWSKPTSYTELESRGETVPTAFWRTFADISRNVPANAGVLLREIPSF